MVAPDDTAFEYLRGRRYVPRNMDEMVDMWRDTLYTDPGASFAKSYTMHADTVEPQVSWGTNPGQTCDITGHVPSPDEYAGGDPDLETGARRALHYMDLESGTPMTDIRIDRSLSGRVPTPGWRIWCRRPRWQAWGRWPTVSGP